EATGNRHGGQACQADTQGVDVGKPVGCGIVTVFTDALGHSWSHRPHDHIALLGKGLLKVIGDHAPHALCLQVVRVVVAVAKHIGTHQYPSNDFGAESLGTGTARHVGQIGVSS